PEEQQDGAGNEGAATIELSNSLAVVPSGEATPVVVSDRADFVHVPLTRVEFALVFAALMLSAFLYAVDQTILSTALDNIIADLGKQDLVSWVGSAYLFSAASLCLLIGKASDIFGRKWILVAAISMFELGSAICGAAQSVEMLIVGRAVAGMGFLAAVAVITCLRFPLPSGSLGKKLRDVDGIGFAVNAAAVVCFLTPLQLGGSDWAWGAPQTIALFIASVFLFALFVFIELRVAKAPMMPKSIFTNRSVPAALGLSFGLGAVFIAAIYYAGLFFQIFLIGSGLLTSAGLVLISFLDKDSSAALQVIYLLILGIGLGMALQTRMIAMQASVDVSHIAVASAALMFINTLGGSVGVAVVGSVMKNAVDSSASGKPTLMAVLSELAVLPQFSGYDLDPSEVVALRGILTREDVQAAVPQAGAALEELIDAFSDGFSTSMRVGVAFSGLVLAFALLIHEYPHAGKKRRATMAEQAPSVSEGRKEVEGVQA
ncbi:hypothetical protein HK405_011271, partial [Cladochytrium tenue]